jgi:hypothetical protein
VAVHNVRPATPETPKLPKLTETKRIPPRKEQYFSFEQVRDALIKCKGLRSKAAKLLGCHRRTIHDYIHRFPELEELDKDLRAAQVDRAMEVLDSHLARGSERSAMFWVRNWGAEFGYGSAQGGVTAEITTGGTTTKIQLNPADAALL